MNPVLVLIIMAFAAFAQDSLKITGQQLATTNEGISFKFSLNKEISELGNSKIFVTPLNSDNSGNGEISFEPIGPFTGNTLSFVVKKAVYEDKPNIQFYISVRDATANPLLETPRAVMSVGAFEKLEKNKAELTRLEGEIEKLKEDIKYKQNLIDSYSKATQATQLTGGTIKFQTHNKIVYGYELNSPGYVIATIKSNAAQPLIGERTEISEFSSTPSIIFENLPMGNYTVTAAIKNIAGASPIDKSPLVTRIFNTLETKVPTIIRDIKIVSENNVLKVVFDKIEDGYYEVSYAEKFGDVEIGTPSFRGRLKSDRSGNLDGEKISDGRNTVVLDKVNPRKNI